MPAPDITRSAKSGVQCNLSIKMARHLSSHFSKSDSVVVMAAPSHWSASSNSLLSQSGNQRCSTEPTFANAEADSHPDRFPGSPPPSGCAGTEDQHSPPACVSAPRTAGRTCSRPGDRKAHRAGFADSRSGKTWHCSSGIQGEENPRPCVARHKIRVLLGAQCLRRWRRGNARFGVCCGGAAAGTKLDTKIVATQIVLGTSERPELDAWRAASGVSSRREFMGLHAFVEIGLWRRSFVVKATGAIAMRVEQWDRGEQARCRHPARNRGIGRVLVQILRLRAHSAFAMREGELRLPLSTACRTAPLGGSSILLPRRISLPQ